MHKALVNHLGGLNLPRKSVVRLTDCPDMTLDVYHGRKTTTQQQQLSLCCLPIICLETVLRIGCWNYKRENTLPKVSNPMKFSYAISLKPEDVAGINFGRDLLRLLPEISLKSIKWEEKISSRNII